MLNLFRAQSYRLVGTLMFWIVPVVWAILLVCWFVPMGQGYSGQEWFGDIPPLASGHAALCPDVEIYLSRVPVVQALPLIVGLMAASFFADDFQGGALRVMDAQPHFRRDYLVASLLSLGMLAGIFLVVSVLVVEVVFGPFFPLLNVGEMTGRTLRWALELWLVCLLYGTMVLGVAILTKSRGLSALFAILLCSGVIERMVFDGLGGLLGRPLGYTIPPGGPQGQIASLMAGTTPQAEHIAAVALGVAAVLAVDWLLLRRKRF